MKYGPRRTVVELLLELDGLGAIKLNQETIARGICGGLDGLSLRFVGKGLSIRNVKPFRRA